MSTASKVVIVDYESGNIGSIVNMLKKIGVDATLSSVVGEVADARRLILPGVGAFDSGMEAIERLGLLEILRHKVTVDRTPLLGICLGMQLLTRGSEEGKRPGFGWIDGHTIRFRHAEGSGLRIPHMGWNRINPSAASAIFSGIGDEIRAYYANSYHVTCENASDVLATTHHGYDFPCIVQHRNVTGMQFHPEKSHRYGMLMLKNYFEADDA